MGLTNRTAVATEPAIVSGTVLEEMAGSVAGHDALRESSLMRVGISAKLRHSTHRAARWLPVRRPTSIIIE
jgi:hypothetical protein